MSNQKTHKMKDKKPNPYKGVFQILISESHTTGEFLFRLRALAKLKVIPIEQVLEDFVKKHNLISEVNKKLSE